MSENSWKGWHSWALLSHKIFQVMKQQRWNESYFKWGEQMIYCFFNAIKYKPFKTRLMIGDILWMLNDDKQKVLTRVLEKMLDETPTWIWILWIPQLISSTMKNRSETASAFSLLKKITTFYPQSSFYLLKKIKSGAGGYDPFGNTFENRERDPLLYEALDTLTSLLSSFNVTRF